MLKKLAEQWIQYKRDEQDANERRLAVESEILELLEPIGLRPGANKVEGLIKITTGTTRKWDNEKLLVLRNSIAEDYFPFKETFSENKKMSDDIEKSVPDLWAIISKALTISPRKPAFEALK